jgi:tetratricopeptide (TPR) repeat protein
MEIQEQLLAAHPDVPDHRADLAGTLNNLGNLEDQHRRSREALAHYRKSIALRQALLREHPARHQDRWRLAGVYENLAGCLIQSQQWLEADAAYRSAIRLAEELVKARPGEVELATLLGRLQARLGGLLVVREQPSEALAACRRAIAVLEQVTATDDAGPAARQSLIDAHWYAAEALDLEKRHAEAVAEWDRALRLDSGQRRPILHQLRADSVARAQDQERQSGATERPGSVAGPPQWGPTGP